MIPQGTKVYFAVKPADLRRSFAGLAALASAELAKDPSQGGLFVFLNRKGDQSRILFRDPHGWCLLSKRLDRGRFRRPPCEGDRFVWELEAAALLSWLQDIDLSRSAPRKPRSSTSRLTLVRTVHPAALDRELQPV
jgi:transposase